MNTNHEIEFKTLLDETTFHQMCVDYPQAILHDQTNVYYESQTMNLKEMGFAIRIRDIEGKHLFTMKQKANQGHHEYEMYLPENSSIAFHHPELVELFTRFDIQGPFVEMGRLHTTRHSVQLQYGELCLDENEYCGIKDYELEFEIDIEHIQEAEQEFKELTSKYNITYQQALPKRTRCLKKRGESQ